MGACFSSDEGPTQEPYQKQYHPQQQQQQHPAGQQHHHQQQQQPNAQAAGHQAQQTGGGGPADPATPTGRPAAPASPSPAPSPAPQPRMFGMDVFTHIQRMQQDLALVNSTAVLGLMEAAELLVRRLDVSLVSIVGFAPESAAGSSLGSSGGGAAVPAGGAVDSSASAGVSGAGAAVLLASHGLGVLCLERTCVMTGRDWSFARAVEQAAAAAVVEGEGAAAAGHNILYSRVGEGQVRAGPAVSEGDSESIPAASRNFATRVSPYSRTHNNLLPLPSHEP
jgi:hypothetical protein